MPDLDLLRDLLIFFGMFVGAGLGLPFPEEVLIVAAGLWTAGQAQYGLYRWLMLPVCVLGVVIADCLLYGIGRHFGTRLLRRRWVARLLPEEKRARIERNFHRYGVNILLFGRLVPGIRSPLFLTAGMMRLSVPRFLLADGIGAVVGNSLLYFLAFWFGDQFRELIDHAEKDVARARPILVLAAILGVGVYFLVQFLKRPVPTGDLEELPIIGHQVAAHIDSTSRRAEPQPPGHRECPGGGAANGEAGHPSRVENRG